MKTKISPLIESCCNSMIYPKEIFTTSLMFPCGIESLDDNDEARNWHEEAEEDPSELDFEELETDSDFWMNIQGDEREGSGISY